MRAIVWDGVELAPHDDIEVRQPGDGEVLVRVDVAGLCHSDLKPIDADIPQDLPVILGHEAVGRVAAVGAGVDTPVGTRVVMTVMRACEECEYCLAGRRILCRRTAAAPPTPFSRDGEPVHQFVRLGAFARETVVGKSQIIAISEDLSDEIAAMLSCATVTAFGAVEERARVQPGESVLIIGAGGIGLNAVIAARAAGAGRIVVADLNPRKEAIARTCGATDFIVPGSVSALALELEPDGFDVVLECVGRGDLLQESIRSLGWGGRVVIVGLPPHGTVIPLEVRDLFRDQSILGCRMGSVDPWIEIPRLAERCLSGEIDLEPLVTKTVELAECATLVSELRGGSVERGFFSFQEA
ncbi:zinc-binding dehydrogenase [Microbacterium sp. NC79]|uniref:zinc-binding dehydrogenase n=1 Tax=Microbacterium sp. NC79 TaxID=2851009 RepID=UPI001C2C5FDE|nr:zinc-binding dehydrogenase [Microbacterium sp. NC79]MBV0896121.1 alcohol dehydrogenase catalytic domain-containing protein [Microbacterium sp. NC79]